jgi:hypothetical protein
MPRSKLKPEVLALLQEYTGLGKASLSVKVTRIKSKYPGLTSNAVAFLIAKEKGKSLLGKLEDEDIGALKDYQLLNRQSPPGIVQGNQRVKTSGVKSSKKPIISYFSTNPSNSYYVNEHIRELTDAYFAGCYTAVFILFRKIVENLIIDIVKAKFPSRIELAYSVGQRRYHDFSVVLQNLYNERNAFSHDGQKLIERLNTLVQPFKKEANDKTHSWFHIVKSPSEVDKDKELQPIIEALVLLEREVGIKTS